MTDHEHPSDQGWGELYRLTEVCDERELDQAEVDRLTELLRSSEAMRRWYLRNALISTMLLDRFGDEHRAREQSTLAEGRELLISDHVVQEALEYRRLAEIEKQADQMLADERAQRARATGAARDNGSESRQPRVIVIPRGPLMALAAAAMVALMVVLYPLVIRQPADTASTPRVEEQNDTRPAPPTPPASPQVALLSRQHEAVWTMAEGLPVPTDGARLSVGTYRLEAGVVEMVMDGGAEVLFTGPCDIRLIDANAVGLDNGALTASVPPRGRGFTVATPSAEIVDYGTEFGISVDEAGGCLTAVFSGLVTVTEKPTSADVPPRRAAVYGGWQSQVGRDGLLQGTIKPLDKQQVFVKNWQDAQYQPGLKGDIIWLSTAPQSVAPEYLVSNNCAMVFLEQAGLDIRQPIDRVAAKPGAYNGQKPGDDRLEPGARVDSYLIHIDPADDPYSDEPNTVTRSGVITFDRPIRAVIARGELICETDGVFGAARTDYGRPAARENWHWYGIEHFENTDAEKRDQFEISQDGKTLRFRLNCNTHLDQLRVLVQSMDTAP